MKTNNNILIISAFLFNESTGFETKESADYKPVHPLHLRKKVAFLNLLSYIIKPSKLKMIIESYFLT
jgi:hypothetical protein